MSKWVIVVDDDIDIFNMGEVNWALATRVQPHRDIFITDNRFVGVALDPSIAPELSRIPRTQTSKIGIDATKFYKGHDFPPLVLDSEERLKQITRRWKEYGFK
jgi:UbiD family decarboxylase